jgi:hypothetical protein
MNRGGEMMALKLALTAILFFGIALVMGISSSDGNGNVVNKRLHKISEVALYVCFGFLVAAGIIKIWL